MSTEHASWGDAQSRDEQRRAIEEDVRAIEKLAASRGWALLLEVMQGEVLQAALNIANNAKMEKDEIDFRRGSIWAANQLLQLPQRMIALKQNDLAMLRGEALSSLDPAKAGSKQE